jgi:hypothetical protein
MIAYSTECGLVVLALVLWCISPVSDSLPTVQFVTARGRRYKLWHLLNNKQPLKTSIQTTHTVLIGNALFFQLGLAIAGLATLWQLGSFYESLMTQHGILLATLGLISALLLKPDFSSIDIFNHCLLFVVFIITTIVIETTISTFVQFGPGHYVDGLCLQSKMGKYIHPKTWALSLVVLPLFVIGMGVWNWLPSKEWKDSLSHRVKRLLSYIHILLQFSAVILTCAVMGMMWSLRKDMQVIAGPSWTEASWGFGQILAVWVWAPVPLSFIILSCKFNFTFISSNPR